MARPSAWQRRARADKWLWAGALLVGAWGLLYPLPYALCILVLAAGALTFLSLPFIQPRRFPLLKKNGKLGIATDIAIILTFLLAARALLDIDLVDWPAPLTMAAVAGLLLALLALSALRRADPAPSRGKSYGILAGFLLLGFGLGLGIAVQANALLDRSAPSTHRLRVEDKWITGRYRRAFLRLAPEVEGLGGTRFHVDAGLYQWAAIGQTVCVQVQQGFLGFRWYWVKTCPEQSA